jgi:hypothetical protein
MSTLYSSRDILGSTKLFSSSSKTEKTLNAELGFHIGIQYMTPAKIDQDLKNLAKVWVSENPHMIHLLDLLEMDNSNVCPFSGKCVVPCLRTSGRLKFTESQIAMLKRRLLFAYSMKYEPEIYFDLLCEYIEKELRKAKRLGNLQLAVRLNGTSDIRWERLNMITGKEDRQSISDKSIIRKFPNVQFYDYTKFPESQRNTSMWTIPDWSYSGISINNIRQLDYTPSVLVETENYHLTYSFNEKTSRIEVLDQFDANRNIAIVFRSELPKQIKFTPNRGFGDDMVEVIDGDQHDLRMPHVDGTSKFIGLTAKGKAKTDFSGFVNDYSATKDGSFYNLDATLQNRMVA